MPPTRSMVCQGMDWLDRQGDAPSSARSGSDAERSALGHDLAGLFGERGVGREDPQRLGHDGVRGVERAPRCRVTSPSRLTRVRPRPERRSVTLAARRLVRWRRARHSPVMTASAARVRATNPGAASRCTSKRPWSSRGRRQGLPSNRLLVTRTASATSRSQHPFTSTSTSIGRVRMSARMVATMVASTRLNGMRRRALVRHDDGKAEARRAVEGHAVQRRHVDRPKVPGVEGTDVGTGLNTAAGFDAAFCEEVAACTGRCPLSPWVTASCRVWNPARQF